MTNFRDLLAPDPASTPGEEQRRASERLADAVARSHLHWWKARQEANGVGKCLLVVVAPYSQYDLTLLDLLDETLEACQSPLPVYVANVLDYASVEQLIAEFPELGMRRKRRSLRSVKPAQQRPSRAAKRQGILRPRRLAWQPTNCRGRSSLSREATPTPLLVRDDSKREN